MRSLSGDVSSRRQGIDSLQKFVKEGCKPTPFFHLWLSNGVDLDPLLCTACVNWRRRCIKKKNQEKPLLQMDQLILFMVCPGKYMLPDHRCVRRLLESLCDPGNPLVQVLPVVVRKIIEGVGELDEKGCLDSWWRNNDKTHFMRYPGAAKMIRLLRKNEEDEFDEGMFDVNEDELVMTGEA